MTATTTLDVGVHLDVPEEAYHADPVEGKSLSSTGARMLLPPGCPAKYRWWADNPPPPKPEFDFGSAAHQLVLGVGPEIVPVGASDWRTKAAKAERDEAHAAGKIPLLVHDHKRVKAMSAALREHETAAALLDPDRGTPEVTLVWKDHITGVTCRARLDWLPESTGGRLIISDYKTTMAAAVEALRKTVHNFGYHQQADFYLDGVRHLGLGDHTTAFVFIFQEKTPPYLVTIVELDHHALNIAARRNRRAREIYAQCAETGHWPGYETDIALLALPPWADREESLL